MSDTIGFEEEDGLKTIELKPMGGGYSRLYISQHEDSLGLVFIDDDGCKQTDFQILDNDLGKLALSWVGLKYE